MLPPLLGEVGRPGDGSGGSSRSWGDGARELWLVPRKAWLPPVARGGEDEGACPTKARLAVPNRQLRLSAAARLPPLSTGRPVTGGAALLRSGVPLLLLAVKRRGEGGVVVLLLAVGTARSAPAPGDSA